MTSQNWLVVVIGAFAALIAYLQWVTAHQIVVLDLFDRRKKAFDELEKAVAPVFRDGSVSNEAFNNLIVAKSSCRFLFGDDVKNYVQKMQEDFAFLAAFTDQVLDQKQEPERSRLIDKKYACLERIVDFHNTAVPIFAPYMRMDLKMKYFPLSPE
jgi:hypothetical protein